MANFVGGKISFLLALIYFPKKNKFLMLKDGSQQTAAFCNSPVIMTGL